MPAFLAAAGVERADEPARHGGGMVVADGGADNHQILEHHRRRGDVDDAAGAAVVHHVQVDRAADAKSAQSAPVRASSASSRPSSTP